MNWWDAHTLHALTAWAGQEGREEMSEQTTFAVGDFVTVVRGVECLDGRHDRSYNGAILKVQAFSWPYCVVVEVVTKHGFKGGNRPFSLDLRDWELGAVDPEYIKAMVPA